MTKKYAHVRQVLVTALIAIVAFSLAVIVEAATELPDIDEATFSNPTSITHRYFSLPIGKRMEFESTDGEERIIIEIPGDTKEVMGIETLVYWDRVYDEEELVEETFDYLAQDDDGNVWYFGEDVDNYVDGEIDNHDGSWLAGDGGALPGYWMPAEEKLTVGYSYREEWFEGEAEDEAEVVSVNEKVDIALGTYTQCVKTKNTTPLEPGVLEYKYYCRLAGGLVLEEEDDTNVELKDVTFADGKGASEVQNRGRIRALQMQLLALLQQLLHLLTR